MNVLVQCNFRMPWQVIVGLAMCTMQAACSTQTTVAMNNASNHPVTITYKDDSHSIAEVLIEPGATREINHLLDVHFSVRTSALIANYSRATVPEEYVLSSGFGPFFKRTVMAQFESDNCIYLLGASSHSGKLPTQPSGFPLCPEPPRK
jgi:hypothetical protein